MTAIGIYLTGEHCTEFRSLHWAIPDEKGWFKEVGEERQAESDLGEVGWGFYPFSTQIQVGR